MLRSALAYIWDTNLKPQGFLEALVGQQKGENEYKSHGNSSTYPANPGIFFS